MDISALSVIAPEIVIAVSGLFLILLDLILPEKEKHIIAYAVIIALAMAVWLNVGFLHSENLAFSGLVYKSGFSVVMSIIFAIAGILTVLVSIDYVKRMGINYGEFYTLLLYSILGMMLITVSNDFLLMYISLELIAVSLYVLVGMMRERERCVEASMKYFLTGLFSSAFLLYGISLLYLTTGTTNIRQMGEVLSLVHTNPNMVKIAVLFVILGLGFEMAIVPFHMWAPDTYEGAPTVVTAFMSVAPKAAVMAALVQFASVTLISIGVFAVDILWFLSLVTMLVGNFFALTQQNVKRMLAYSSIAHVGYMLIGVTAVVASPDVSAANIVFYLLVYAFMNIGAFSVIVLLSEKEGMGESLSDFSGLGKRSPAAAALMAIFMFSLAGIPPAGGFLSKFWVFRDGLNAGLLWLVIFGVLNSAISAYYYLRVVMAMYTKEPEEKITLCWSPAIALSLIIMMIGVLTLGIFPAPFMNLAQIGAGLIF